MVTGVMALLTSCGGGDGAASVEDNGIFGELPAVAAEYGGKGMEQIDRLLKAEKPEEVKDFPAEMKKIDSLANAALTEAQKQLVGKELPTEVAAEPPSRQH